jgi:hypothetical protein
VHGTVAEPFNPVFPNAGALMLYTAGYNLAESFFFNQRWLYWQNLYVGDPLATPYGERPRVTGPTGAVTEGTPAVFTASHPAGIRSMTCRRGGVQVAEADGPVLEVDLEGLGDGDSVDLFVVAVSDDEVLDRPGWPEESPLARARIQGWVRTTVEVGPPIADEDPEPDDCACSQARPTGSPAVLALAAFGLSRRNKRRLEA